MKIERCTSWNPWGVTLESADDDYDREHARIVVYAFRRRFEWRLPQIVKPYRIRHVAGWDTATVARMGRDWYDEIHPREFGFRVSDGFLQVFLGPQTNDSTTTRDWSCFLPWTQWRFVRHSFYSLEGVEVYTFRESRRRRTAQETERLDAARRQVPKACFRFLDFDGETIDATTHIQEREWKRGEKWCSWLSLFYRPMVRRSLDIAFSRETGPRKGSWKGGTIGTGIEMLPGELHEAAFRRYCAKNNMAFLETVQ